MRVLLIDPDRAAAQALGLGCVDRRVGVAIAETLCEGVRTLLATSVSLIVADRSLLRLTPSEHATLFDRVAPGVPVVVTVGPETSLDVRVGFELAGFRVLVKPVGPDEVLDRAAVAPAAAGGGA